MPKIIVYSTPTCVYCNIAKSFFKSHNIEYKEIDVSESEDAAKKMVEKSGQMGVPVIDIDGQIIVGFDKTKILELLNIKE